MTIPIAKVHIGYSEAKKLLDQMGIEYDEDLEKAKHLSSTDFTYEFKKISFTNNYMEIYSTARKNLDYNLLLKDDGALFQFGIEIDSDEKVSDIRYAYYEAPTKIISYEEYLSNEGYEIAECGDIFFEYYDQYKMEESLKESVVFIRYDFSHSQYEQNKHPISHLHFGQQNDIRIPISTILSPKSFVAFILRHVYWDKWKTKLDDPNFRKLYLNSKRLNESLKPEFFCDEEKLDLYIV